MPLRQPVVAGQFYPAEASALIEEVRRYLAPPHSLHSADSPHASATPAAPEPAIMAFLPHAGYMFCGEVLGSTLARTQLPSTLVLLGPNHTGRGAPLSVWPEGQWRTPLGSVPVDDELASALIASDAGFQADTEAHAFEHSLEVLLPFLQTHIPNLRIVPIAVAGLPLPMLQKAGQALATAMTTAELRHAVAATPATRRVGMVVSSDMNHFASHEQTLKLDKLALEQLLRMDEAALATTVHHEKISMCGVHPACVALSACRQLNMQQNIFVTHCTSGPASGDMNRVVGYAGAYVRDNACQKLPNEVI